MLGDASSSGPLCALALALACVLPGSAVPRPRGGAVINLAPALDTVNYEAAGLRTFVNVTAQLLAVRAWQHFRTAAQLVRGMASPRASAALGRAEAAARAEQELLLFASAAGHGGHVARRQLYSLLEQVYLALNTEGSRRLALRCRATAKRLGIDNAPRQVARPPCITVKSRNEICPLERGGSRGPRVRPGRMRDGRKDLS